MEAAGAVAAAEEAATHDYLQRTTALTPLQHTLTVSTSLSITKLPVSLRLRASLPMWELINSDKWVLEVIKLGYKPRFNRPPPLTTEPKWFTVSPLKASALQAEIDLMLQKQVIEPVVFQRTPGFYSRIFLVPKKNGKFRPVIDLSPLNRYLMPKFKMLTS